MASFRDLLSRPPTDGVPTPDGFAPPWLCGPLGQAFLGGLGDGLDFVADAAKQAVKARFPGSAAPSTKVTNLILYSQDPTNVAWMKTALTDGGATTAPDGTATGRLYTSTATATATLAQSVTLTIGVTYTFSAWLRCAAGTTVNIGGTYAGNTLVAAGATWQRFQVTFTPSAGANSLWIGNGSWTLGVGIEVWGFQVEAASPAHDYVPTTSAAAFAMFSGPVGPNSAPGDALARIGQERGIDRGIVEPESGYRARLQNAMALWQWGGTPYGLLAALWSAGYPNPIIQTQSGKQFSLAGYTGNPASDLIISTLAAPVHLGGTPTELWSDIAVLILQPWPAWWGAAAPADGSQDQKTVAALVKSWKPAHCRCVSLKAIQGPTWGLNMTWGSFVWGSGSSVVWTSPVG